VGIGSRAAEGSAMRPSAGSGAVEGTAEAIMIERSNCAE